MSESEPSAASAHQFFWNQDAHFAPDARRCSLGTPRAAGMETASAGPQRLKGEYQMNRYQRAVLLLGLLLFSAALLGCANNNEVATSVYEQDYSRARASIAAAEQAGAAEFGNAELALAREKLRAAEDAAEDGAIERAQRLAVEADLDADLAAAIARNQQTQSLVSEVRSGLSTLEDELRRSGSESFARP
jgi:Domain of unknown function (DUF4398)